MRSRRNITLGTEQRRVQQAIKAAGGVLAVAQAAEINRTSVYRWVYRGQIPAQQVGRMAQLSGIAERLLRPDLYQAKSANVCGQQEQVGL